LIALSSIVVSCSDYTLAPLEHFQEVEPRKTVSLRINNYCPLVGNRFVEFFATPFSYAILDKKIAVDYDRDGIPNVRDISDSLNLHPRRRDTNLDGYHDLLMLLSGIHVTSQANIKPCLQIHEDTDNDGLTDCEEDFLGTDKESYDTDGDTIPDYLELRVGLNPTNSIDARQDSDIDGVLNLEEVKEHTPVLEMNDKIVEGYALIYKTIPAQNGTSCGDFLVENIALVSVSNGNLVQLYFIEESPNEASRQFISKNIVISKDQKSGETLEYEYIDL